MKGLSYKRFKMSYPRMYLRNPLVPVPSESISRLWVSYLLRVMCFHCKKQLFIILSPVAVYRDLINDNFSFTAGTLRFSL